MGFIGDGRDIYFMHYLAKEEGIIPQVIKSLHIKPRNSINFVIMTIARVCKYNYVIFKNFSIPRIVANRQYPMTTPVAPLYESWLFPDRFSRINPILPFSPHCTLKPFSFSHSAMFSGVVPTFSFVFIAFANCISSGEFFP